MSRDLRTRPVAYGKLRKRMLAQLGGQIAKRAKKPPAGSIENIDNLSWEVREARVLRDLRDVRDLRTHPLGLYSKKAFSYLLGGRARKALICPPAAHLPPTYAHIPLYTSICLHIPAYTIIYLHIPSYTQIPKIFNIKNMRVNMRSKNGHISGTR